MNTDYDSLLQACGILSEGHTFLQYAEQFYTQEAGHDLHISLKITHSFAVLANVAQICTQEAYFIDTPQASKAALLAALFHDVARFYQFSTYGTFSDAHSCNHGLLGGAILKKQGFLAREAPAMQSQIIAAVLLHNRMMLPSALSQELTMLSHVVRDADKLDIFRVLQEHFSPDSKPEQQVIMQVKVHPSNYTPFVYEKVLAGELVAYSDMQWLHDFRLLVCGWLDGLYYPSARKMLVQSGYLHAVLDELPDTPKMHFFRQHFLQKAAAVLAHDTE